MHKIFKRLRQPFFTTPTVDNPQQLSLNHYAIMSREYFSKVKMTRGDADNQKVDNIRDWNYFDRYDHKEVEDEELKQLLS